MFLKEKCIICEKKKVGYFCDEKGLEWFVICRQCRDKWIVYRNPEVWAMRTQMRADFHDALDYLFPEHTIEW